LIGPVSPTNGDDWRGLLIDGFEQEPYVFTSYNPSHYQELLDKYGFNRKHVFLAFHFNLNEIPLSVIQERIDRVKARHGFDIRHVEFKQLKKCVNDIFTIMNTSMPVEWSYLVPPEESELMREARNLKNFTFPKFVQIAYKEDRPIGFAAVIPDYNLILKRLRGRLSPLGLTIFLLGRRKIKRGRAFLLFVIPEYQGKGVSRAILYELFRAAKEMNYTEAEGSSIDAENKKMVLEAFGAGGKIYRKFALYEMEL
ncbi:MAG: GNAT family N-acetyltransferase, partial [Candidatus Atribacteria bacterium]|nr:GNAT family N-acetyltransferase [Candidatus Atribacteria bacterium]